MGGGTPSAARETGLEREARGGRKSSRMSCLEKSATILITGQGDISAVSKAA